ncbi:MAG TPA: calcium-binding protein [Nitrososphaeraceae archaeon]|nr:calcium-binding protein [Nitrososphaeraceae archaeon]
MKKFQTKSIISSTIDVRLLFLLVIGSIIVPLPNTWGSDSSYNVIEGACSIGSIITTDGTNGPDIMIGCDLEDVMYCKADNDVLQGRFDDGTLYGHSGDDNLEGGEGGDELYAGRGDDVIFAGFDDDFLVGGDGNDELYGQDGNDILEGGRGADYFDCGDGLDVIIDFEPSKGDTHTNNCEDVREHL